MTSSNPSIITPLSRLVDFMRGDRQDLFVLLVYTMASGLLTLTVPLAAQALVNTIAAGVFIQPLIVLTFLVFIGLVFAGIMKVLQFSLVELLQQRIFARVAIQLAQRLPSIEYKALMTDYPPELVNRFFDVVKIQKSLAKILLDGPAALLQIVIGLTLMAFYSPLLLAFDLGVLSALAFSVFVLGRSGLATSLSESIEKYRVAAWLQDIARCQVSFKADSTSEYTISKTDNILGDYLQARESHFRVLFRQAWFHYFCYALASATILGVGGWLVINRQLTLGQLVASELIVVIVLAAMEKLMALYQEWYDLLTGIEKIGHVIDLPVERTEGLALSSTEGGIKVVCRNVKFAYPGNQKWVLNGLDLVIPPGGCVSLIGTGGSGKSTLASLLCGFISTGSGSIEIDDIDLQDIQLDSLRENLAIVRDLPEIFEGTIEENIFCGRSNLSHLDLRLALEKTLLLPELSILPQGLKTPLVSGGGNLSRGFIQQLLMARAIVDKPRLLILDEAFTGMDPLIKHVISDNLFAQSEPWTVICISHDIELILKTNSALMFGEGKIIEAGSPETLVNQPQSYFAQLFGYRRII